MNRLSLFVLLLSSAAIIHAQEGGVLTVNVNSTTAVNNSPARTEQDSVALKYTVGEVGNEPFNWNNDWTVSEAGADQYELSDGAGDIIYLAPNANNNQDIGQVLSDPAVSPNGSNSSVASYVGNAVTRLFSPGQAQVLNQTTIITVTNTTTGPVSTPASASSDQESVNVIVPAPEGIAEAPEVVEAVEAVEQVQSAASQIDPAVIVSAVPVAAIIGAANEAGQGLAEAVSDAVPNVNQVGREVAEAVEEAAPAVSEAVQEVAPQVVQAVEEVAPEVAEALEEAAPTINEAVEEAAQAAEEVAPEVIEAVQEAVPVITEAAQELIPETVPDVEEAAAEVIEAVQEAAPAISEAAQEVVPVVREAVEEVAPEAVQAVEEAAAEVAEAVQEAVPAISEAVQEVVPVVPDVLVVPAVPVVSEAVEEAAEEVTEAVEEAAEEVTEAVEEAAAEVSEAVEQVVPIVSESAEEVAQEAAENTVEADADVAPIIIARPDLNETGETARDVVTDVEQTYENGENENENNNNNNNEAQDVVVFVENPDETEATEGAADNTGEYINEADNEFANSEQEVGEYADESEIVVTTRTEVIRTSNSTSNSQQ